MCKCKNYELSLRKSIECLSGVDFISLIYIFFQLHSFSWHSFISLCSLFGFCVMLTLLGHSALLFCTRTPSCPRKHGEKSQFFPSLSCLSSFIQNSLAVNIPFLNSLVFQCVCSLSPYFAASVTVVSSLCLELGRWGPLCCCFGLFGYSAPCA